MRCAPSATSPLLAQHTLVHDYQPTSASAAAWRSLTLLLFEARIVGSETLSVVYLVRKWIIAGDFSARIEF